MAQGCVLGGLLRDEGPGEASSLASCRIDIINADLMKSGTVTGSSDKLLTRPDGDGCLNAASAAEFDLPGRCSMSNRHGSVRCFSRKSLEFVISSRVRSPNIFTRGLWSVITRRLSHPWVKYFVCSRRQATARASPSMAA